MAVFARVTVFTVTFTVTLAVKPSLGNDINCIWHLGYGVAVKVVFVVVKKWG